MFNNQPITMGPRTTATSAAEGRLKPGIPRRKKNRILREKIDGRGGCGKKKSY